MTIPNYQAIMAPLLHRLADGQPHRVRDLADELAKDFGLTDEELSEVLPSGRSSVWRSRLHWATQYLSQARAIDRLARGVFAINDRGRALLAEHPDRIGNDELEPFQEFREFRARSRAVGAPSSPQGEPAPVLEVTPDERIAAAVAEVHAAVASELLQRIGSQPPHFLERLVLRLLVAMGYAGARGSTDHLGRSGDEGVDGVIKQDALGLDRIYIQAKRYALDRTIGRPEIQAFVGALQGAQASRGVFITTGKVSREGREYVDRVPQHIVLLDGTELARLMIEHGVGVQAERTFILVKVDEDLFD